MQIFALIAVAPSIVSTWFALVDSLNEMVPSDTESKTTQSELDTSSPLASALPVIMQEEEGNKGQEEEQEDKGQEDEGGELIRMETMPTIESTLTNEIEETG